MTTARNIMSKKVISIEMSISALEIAKIMDRNKVSCVIITKNDKPYGIVTERDLLSKITARNEKPSTLNASDILTSPITLVTSLTPVEEIAEKMILNKVRRVVVVDNEQPIGIITVTDFVKHLKTILDSQDGYKDLYNNLFEEYEHWNN